MHSKSDSQLRDLKSLNKLKKNKYGEIIIPVQSNAKLNLIQPSLFQTEKGYNDSSRNNSHSGMHMISPAEIRMMRANPSPDYYDVVRDFETQKRRPLIEQ